MDSIVNKIKNTKKIPNEIEEGNIEYKRKIIPESINRFEGLSTQLTWRLNEGNRLYNKKEAFYIIGINDNGTYGSIKIKIIKKSLDNLSKIAKMSSAKIDKTKIYFTKNGVVAVVKIINIITIKNKKEYNVIFLGNSGVGKSSIIGSLCYGINDDGNGLARYNILRYKHERLTGITSSIKTNIIGISDNNILNYNSFSEDIWENIYINSDTIINLIDVPGCKKFIKTTLFGLTAYKPDHIIIVTTGNDCIEYIDIIKALQIPYSIVFNKIDKYFCNDKNVIPFSCISHENLDKLKDLFKKINISNCKYNSINKEFLINEVMIIPDVGTVISGIMIEGNIKIGDKLMLGPINKSFYEIKVNSIHKKQIPLNEILQKESATMIINNPVKINKNMILVSTNMLINCIDRFCIKLKYINFQLKINSRYMIHINNICETVIIKKIDDVIHISFVSKRNVYYIKLNDSVIIRHNDKINVGYVSKI